jgi:dTDP-glucose 4,6-dehydratase
LTTIVTGGAGFIGSALVRALVGAGETVVTVDKLTYAGNPANLAAVADAANHVFVEADICDATAMRAVFRQHRPSAIYHLAAESHVDRSIDSAVDFAMTNVVGTVTLLEAATAYWRALPAATAASFRFLMVSTDEVFGELGAAGAFDEASPYRPGSPYAASKAGADHLARAWFRTHGLPVLISNCSNNYGPYQFPEKLIPLTILNALEGRPLPVYGRGENVRDWLHVDDHVDALRRVVARGAPGETYLVGGRCERRNIDLVRALCGILDERQPAGAPHDRLIAFVADRPGHDARYAIDATRIESELGWRPRVGFTEGLRRTVDWYLDNRDWCAGATQRYGRGRLGLRAAGDRSGERNA